MGTEALDGIHRVLDAAENQILAGNPEGVRFAGGQVIESGNTCKRH